MPEPTAEEVAEASAKMAAEFETQAADMRQHWEQHLGARHRLVRTLHATPGAFYEQSRLELGGVDAQGPPHLSSELMLGTWLGLSDRI